MRLFLTYVVGFVAATLLGQQLSAQTLEAGWRLEEGAGTTAFDSSGNNYDGTLMGGAMWTGSAAPVPSGSNFAVQFDGTDDLIDTPYVGISGDTNRTVSAWINTTDDSSGGGFIGWGDSNDDGEKWHVRVNDAAPTGMEPRVQGALRTEAQGGNYTSSRVIADGQWHHVVSVLDGTNNTDVRHWIDGRLDLTSYTAPVAINTDTTGDPVTLGVRNQQGTNNFYAGALDETAIYSGALSPREIRRLATGSDLPVATINYDATVAPGGDETQNVFVNNPGFDGTSFDLQSTGTLMTNNDPANRLGVENYWSYNGSSGSQMFDSADLPNAFQDVPGDPTDDSASFLMTVRRGDQMADQILFETGGSGDGTSLTLSGDTLQFTTKNSGTDALASFDLGSAGVGDFIQILGVVDLDMDLIELYVDGELVDDDVFTGSDWAGSDDGGLAGMFGGAIGGDAGAIDLSGYGSFDGDIANFSYFTEALDATDAQNLFLAAIPEPASIAMWSLLGLGLAAFGYRRLRRQTAG